MLTRGCNARTDSPSRRKAGATCSVGISAQDRPTGASSAGSSRSARSRQSGSGTKRASADGRVSTSPRGANQPVKLVPSRIKAKAQGQPKAKVEVQPAGGNACVFVLGRSGKALMPTTPARARVLLGAGKAVVARLHPFSIRLKDRVGGELQPLVLLSDPGSKATGIALCRVETTPAGEVIRHALWLGELLHRGAAISKSLTQRSGYRRRRRSQNLRYRAPRFDNRTRPKGWLAPSLQHRVDTTTSQTSRLRRLAPITSLGMELVRFDIQAMENPEISGVEYENRSG